MRRLLWVVCVFGVVAATVGSSGVSAEITTDGNQVLSQRGPLAGTPEDFDGFGWSLAVGDFDGDGFDDAAIGVPDEDIGTIKDAGMVTVVYGSPGGLDVERNDGYTQSGPIRGTPEFEDLFGWSLTAGDFDGDGFDDLAVGAPGESLGAIERAGIVHVLWGSADGISVEGNDVVSQAEAGIWGIAEERDWFGWSFLEAGDFDGDGHDDLVVGTPFESLGSVENAGVVQVLYGAPTGVSRFGDDVIWDPSGTFTFGLFASSGAVGDFDADGFDDLALGNWTCPDGGPHLPCDAGDVHVIYGARWGLSLVGFQRFSQAGPIVGTPELSGPIGDAFGAAVAAADFDGDGFDDLAIGVPGEFIGDIGGIVGAGMVNVIYGGPGGLSTAGNQGFSQAGPIRGAPEDDDAFGFALAAGDVDADGRADLVIGAPGEALGETSSAGMVHILSGTAAGLTTGGNQWLTQADAVEERPGNGDRFGTTLAVGDFNGDGASDLLVAAPQESVGSRQEVGVVHVFYGQLRVADLESVDWENLTYALPSTARCDQAFDVNLTEGRADPSSRNGGLFWGLGEVVFGAMGVPAQPVAAVRLSRAGAGSFPSVVLVYGADGARLELAGVVDGNHCHTFDADAHRWSVWDMAITDDGTLEMTGLGWDQGAHCCPDLSVALTVGLGPDGALYEVDYVEVPR